MTGFQAPTCATCGHAVGEHRTVAAALNIRHGICLRDGCDCRKFIERDLCDVCGHPSEAGGHGPCETEEDRRVEEDMARALGLGDEGEWERQQQARWMRNLGRR